MSRPAKSKQNGTVVLWHEGGIGLPLPGTSVMDYPCPARALLECQRMGEEVRSRVVGGGGCRRAIVPTYPAVCRCRLVRVCPSGLTHGPFRVQKGLGSVWVSRDPVEILPQTILLSPRGVSGISGLVTPAGTRVSRNSHRCVAWKQQHFSKFMGAIPLAMSLVAERGPEPMLRQSHTPMCVRGVCASFHQRPPILNRRILSRTTSPRSGAVRSHIHLQSHTKGHPRPCEADDAVLVPLR